MMIAKTKVTPVDVGPTDNANAATVLPPKERAQQFNGFIDFATLHPLIPVCEKTLRDAIRKGLIPSIMLPGGRRRLFHWETVQAALLRMNRGLE
jgi:hypothetical protein